MNFVDILDELNIPYQGEGEEGVREGWINLCCPYCPHEGTGKFYLGYSLERNACTCWTCGSHSLADVLVHSADISYADAKKLLGDLDRSEVQQRKSNRGKLVLPPNLGHLTGHHDDYLLCRGFDPATIEKQWKIQAIGTSAKYAWRIFIPVYSNGVMVSWTTRAIREDAIPKYWSASPEQEILNHKTLLYGADHARHTVIVVEGPLDVWAIGYGAVGTFGTGFNPSQVRAIAKFPNRFVCFDAEPAGQKRASELCDLLAPFPGQTTNILLETGKDPAEAKCSEISQIRRLLY